MPHKQDLGWKSHRDKFGILGEVENFNYFVKNAKCEPSNRLRGVKISPRIKKIGDVLIGFWTDRLSCSATEKAELSTRKKQVKVIIFISYALENSIKTICLLNLI